MSEGGGGFLSPTKPVCMVLADEDEGNDEEAAHAGNVADKTSTGNHPQIADIELREDDNRRQSNSTKNVPDKGGQIVQHEVEIKSQPRPVVLNISHTKSASGSVIQPHVNPGSISILQTATGKRSTVTHMSEAAPGHPSPDKSVCTVKTIVMTKSVPSVVRSQGSSQAGHPPVTRIIITNPIIATSVTCATSDSGSVVTLSRTNVRSHFTKNVTLSTPQRSSTLRMNRSGHVSPTGEVVRPRQLLPSLTSAAAHSLPTTSTHQMSEYMPTMQHPTLQQAIPSNTVLIGNPSTGYKILSPTLTNKHATPTVVLGPANPAGVLSPVISGMANLSTSSPQPVALPANLTSTSMAWPQAVANTSLLGKLPLQKMSKPTGHRHIMPAPASTGGGTGSQSNTIANLSGEIFHQAAIKAHPPNSNNKSQQILTEKSQNFSNILEASGIRPRKPCNCTKSQCLKLYCDCFSNGEFCNNCNCNNCFNNLDHEEERQKAIHQSLERNPSAFCPKIVGKGAGVENDRRHQKGCNCKKSGCLKNYCECFEAKINCTSLCKCVGCKNYEDSSERRTLMWLSHSSGTRPEQVQAPAPASSRSKLMAHIQGMMGSQGDGGSYDNSKHPIHSYVTRDVVSSIMKVLYSTAHNAEREKVDKMEREAMVITEFGRCLVSLLQVAYNNQASATVKVKDESDSTDEFEDDDPGTEEMMEAS